MTGTYRPRLCTLRKWTDYSGYGFSLHATKGKSGHFISEIDCRSPAGAGGLRDKDYVVEVNGVNVLCEPHMEVVSRIREDPNQVTLLVLDPESREYFTENTILVDSYMDNIEKITCPDSNPFTEEQQNEVRPAEVIQEVHTSTTENAPKIYSPTNGYSSDHENSTIQVVYEKEIGDENNEIEIRDSHNRDSVSSNHVPTIVEISSETNHVPTVVETSSGTDHIPTVVEISSEANHVPTIVEISNQNHVIREDPLLLRPAQSLSKAERRKELKSNTTSFAFRAKLVNEL